MKKLIFIYVMILNSFLCVDYVLCAEEVYESATEYDYPPFSITSGDEADGFSVELLKAAAEVMGVHINFKIDEWHTIKKELEEGKLDVLPLVGYTPERDEMFDFTIPYIVLRGNIFVRDDYKNIQTEDDLFGKSIIVMKGDNSQEYAEKMGFTEDLVLVDTYAEGLLMLARGEHDALLAQGIVGEMLIEELGIKNISPVYEYTNNGQEHIRLNLTGYEQKFCFAVREGDKELLALLNEGLAIVSENGTYNELYRKWFPFLINDGPTFLEVFLSMLYIIVPGLIVILLIALVLVKRQVKQKTVELQQRVTEIEYLSYHDKLTQLYNRHFFEAEFSRLDDSRYYPISIVMADLNGLKLVNDAFGHFAGDDMIAKAAEAIKNQCRNTDIAARWGGDEFVMIFPNTSFDKAMSIVERIQNHINTMRFDYGILSMAMGCATKVDENQSLKVVFNEAEAEMYHHKALESERIYAETIWIVIDKLFEKHKEQQIHADNVSHLAVQLAIKLDLHPDMIADIKILGRLHDIGKVVIAPEIIDKKGPLTTEEYGIMKEHTASGYRMLSMVKEFARITKGVLYHHERMDGKGYPEGLTGRHIPIEARIIGMVDAYDAMTSERTYKDAIMTVEEAIVELKKHSGTQFDPDLVKVFVEEVIT